MHGGLILLGDTDPNARSSTARLLREAGYTVMEFDSGEELLQRLASVTPNLVITELSLYGTNGLDAVRRGREMIGGAKVPFFFFTRKNTLGDFREALEAGGHDFYLKDEMDKLLHRLSLWKRQQFRSGMEMRRKRAVDRIEEFLDNEAEYGDIGRFIATLDSQILPDLINELMKPAPSESEWGLPELEDETVAPAPKPAAPPPVTTKLPPKVVAPVEAQKPIAAAAPTAKAVPMPPQVGTPPAPAPVPTSAPAPAARPQGGNGAKPPMVHPAIAAKMGTAAAVPAKPGTRVTAPPPPAGEIKPAAEIRAPLAQPAARKLPPAQTPVAAAAAAKVGRVQPPKIVVPPLPQPVVKAPPAAPKGKELVWGGPAAGVAGNAPAQAPARSAPPSSSFDDPHVASFFDALDDGPGAGAPPPKDKA